MVQRSVARDTARVTRCGRTSKGDVRACPTLRLELLYCTACAMTGLIRVQSCLVLLKFKLIIAPNLLFKANDLFVKNQSCIHDQ
jgi:late competence protein required for DNA uptake (superfamily II DNA/RNA helicase)